MKSINNIKFPFLIAAVVFILTGCHKTNNNATPTALVGLHLHTYIDTNLVNTPGGLTQEYPDHNGRWEVFTLAQFYLTNLQLHNAQTQQWYLVTGSILLKRVQNEEYIIANVPAATYDDLRFTVGLNNTLNSAAPSTYPTSGSPDTVLSSTEQAVMWGSNSTAIGYTFMNLQGFVDTSAAHNLTNAIPFSYQLGGMNDTVQITLPVNQFTLVANDPAVQLIHIICDYGKLLQNTPMLSPTTGSFFGTSPQQNVATSIWTIINVQGMFRYECTTPTTDC